jgi:hypothetical protein
MVFQLPAYFKYGYCLACDSKDKDCDPVSMTESAEVGLKPGTYS